MKTIRKKLRHPTVFLITCAPIGGQKQLTLHHSIFYADTKKTTNRDNTKKFNENLRENEAEALKACFAPQKMFN